MAKDISFHSPQIKKLEKDLGKFRFALPVANQRTLNRAVDAVQVNAKRRVAKQMIIRNKWTLGSIQTDKPKGFSTPRIVGSLQEYMADQEFGTIARSQGKQGRRMTTSYASGEGEGARPRKRVARGANKIKKIRIKNSRYKAKNKKQRALVAIKQAAKSGRKYVYLDMPWTKGKKGIYKVIGGKRRPRIKMVHSLKKKSVVIKRSPWLKPSVDAIVPLMPRFYMMELQAQANRHFKKK